MTLKVTTRYFLNKHLKAYKIGGIAHYRCYVRVIANRQNSRFPSETYRELYSDEMFKRLPKETEELEGINAFLRKKLHRADFKIGDVVREFRLKNKEL